MSEKCSFWNGVQTSHLTGQWVVYGLISPRAGWIFYVGVTSNLGRRLNSHYACSEGNATVATIKEMKEEGLRFSHCVFGVYGDKKEAYEAERAIIGASPTLVNRMSYAK